MLCIQLMLEAAVNRATLPNQQISSSDPAAANIIPLGKIKRMYTTAAGQGRLSVELVGNVAQMSHNLSADLGACLANRLSIRWCIDKFVRPRMSNWLQAI